MTANFGWLEIRVFELEDLALILASGSGFGEALFFRQLGSEYGYDRGSHKASTIAQKR